MKKAVFFRISFIFLFAIVLAFFPICRNIQDVNLDSGEHYFISGTRVERRNLEEFFALLTIEPEGSQEQLAVVMEIVNTYIRQKEFGKLINFLSSRIHRYPDDPYNTYYLFTIAFVY